MGQACNQLVQAKFAGGATAHRPHQLRLFGQMTQQWLMPLEKTGLSPAISSNVPAKACGLLPRTGDSSSCPPCCLVCSASWRISTIPMVPMGMRQWWARSPSAATLLAVVGPSRKTVMMTSLVCGTDARSSTSCAPASRRDRQRDGVRFQTCSVIPC